MKLIEMTDFVLEYDSEAKTPNDFKTDFTEYVFKYARFLKQPLTLGMFVPCDEDGNYLEKPKIHELDHSEAVARNYEYQQALSRVVFEGFEIHYQGIQHVQLNCSGVCLDYWYKDNEFEKSGAEIKTISDLTQYGITIKEGVI